MKSKIGVISGPTKWTLVQQKPLKKGVCINESSIVITCHYIDV